MNLSFTVPPELAWLLPFYTKKAEIRSRVGGDGTIESEVLVALEQLAIEAMRPTSNCDCPMCRGLDEVRIDRKKLG